MMPRELKPDSTASAVENSLTLYTTPGCLPLWMVSPVAIVE